MDLRAGGRGGAHAGKFFAGRRGQLIAFARHEFDLSAKQGDSTIRQHLLAGWKNTGRRPPQLDGPPCPEDLRYVWSWFVELSQRRTRGMSATPLTWLEFDGWQRLTGVTLTAFELDCLKALDLEFLAEPKAVT